MDRPVRLYKHVFTRSDQRLEFVLSGCTPCEAKAKAFRALETKLRADSLPRLGWRLYQQLDVTHLASV